MMGVAPTTQPQGTILTLLLCLMTPRYVDFINLVAHDLDFSRPWRPRTSHHSPLFPKLLNEHDERTADSCVSAVRHWSQLGMPHEKIVLGIPLYARLYQLADPSENGWGSKALGEAVLPFNQVCQLLKEGSVTVMDKTAYAPYANLGDVWISYENVESVVLKVGAFSFSFAENH
ncbi:hypothetical protein MTO96_048409 [Rhipicephalus appendiculatus]